MHKSTYELGGRVLLESELGGRVLLVSDDVQYSSPCISISRDTARSNENISSSPVNILAS